MHPAFSVIFFTVISGFGYGLVTILSLCPLPPDASATKIVYILAFLAVSSGLLSSTFHLKNPQRAWRAFSQWRSSWLSREGVLAILTFIPLSAQILLVVIFDSYSFWLGILLSISCLATVLSTAMIYASLKTVHAWHSPLTVANYLGFAIAAGAVALSAVTTDALSIYGAICLLILSWMIKYAWYYRMDTIQSPSTVASATGLDQFGKVRLLERPHMNDNYLTYEMGFVIARKHAHKLRLFTYSLGLLAPLLFLITMLFVQSNILGIAATCFYLLGIFIERWLFFAEAKHSVMLYYGNATA